MKTTARKIYWLITQFGFNPIFLYYSIKGIPKYIFNYLQFKKIYTGSISIVPCLRDWYEEGGSTKTEYFWQDLHVAQKIFNNNPRCHVDIGSRVDGFVAHVASYREIEVFDIRNITSNIPNIIFKQANIMEKVVKYENYCDSLSCLHAIEHFGLGRYGDPLNIDGYKMGLINMTNIIKLDGYFYLSTPTGKEHVEFNANRIFNPVHIKNFIVELGFKLIDFSWFDDDKTIHTADNFDEKIFDLSTKNYTLGIFTFKKI